MIGVMDPPEVTLDWNSQEMKRDPFPAWGRLRAAGPVVRARVPFFGMVWMATTHEAVNDLLRDPQRFVQSPAAAGNRWMEAIVGGLPRGLKPLASNMLLRDPPDHRRLRSLVEQAFRRQSIEAIRPRLEALADEALDRLEAQAAHAGGVVDLIADFARPFPLAVICEILGLPPEDRPRFTRWASQFSTAEGFLGIVEGLLIGVRRFLGYVRQEFRRQSVAPREGLMAALIEAEEAGDRLSEDELVAMVFLLLAAGHETTLHQIALGVLTLLDRPRRLDELRADWGLAGSAADELLRHVSFAQISKPRYARETVEFHGRTIGRGQVVFACLAAANSDPAVFERPAELDLRRHPNRHVAFGAGIHVCLGATLARVETAVAYERLFTRFPGLRLAVPPEALRFSARFGTRSLVALPVRW
jgi:cytochrome P450